MPQYMGWSSSWEKLLHKILSDLLALDLEANGPWEEFQEMYERALSSVLPKPIPPLESVGRNIKPSLLHGDLWDGNIGTDNETGRPFIFDASSFYRHHELGLGMWRGFHLNRMRFEVYWEEYLRIVGKS